jgi:sugar transferase (PEP-CTERM/EpsH1 system associated)
VTDHIVHIVHRFDTGGMENGMVNLFNTLSPTRFRHTVVALTDYSGFRHRVTAQRVDFHALHRAPGNGLGWTIRLWKLLRALKPDLVHTRNLAALEAQFVAAAAGIRATVHGEHGRDVFDLHGRNWKYNLLRRAARPLVSNYITVSRDLEGWLRRDIGVPARRVHQIYNGVDSVKFHPRSGPRPDSAHPDSIVFGSVGRMVAVKDYPLLVRAFIQMLRQQPDRAERARLVIVGEGPVRQECLDMLQGAGLAHLAWLPGERDDIAAILQALDVFVLPSRNEGISNTILEAFASGLPVIATAVGGNVELVEGGVNGQLVASEDLDGMVRALLDYLDSPARITGHGRNARKLAEQRFSIPVMAAAYTSVYEQTLAAHAGRSSTGGKNRQDGDS